MTGLQLKTLLMQYQKTQSEVASLIGETKQNFNSALRSDDVRSSLIERISAALNIPISKIYGEAPETLAMAEGTNNTAIAGSGNNVNDGRFLELLKEKEQQIDKLLDVIKSLSQ